MFSWQAGLITLLVVQHLSITAFSIYAHRGMGHHLFIFKPMLAHAFRFWLWFASGHCWPNWQQHYAAKHRKHHKYSDSELDPHSPFRYTFAQMFDVSHDDSTRANYISLDEIKLYAPDIVSPTDWINSNLYQPYPKLGMGILWAIFTALFGVAGFAFGALNYFYVGDFFIFVGNYAFHKFGFTYAKNPGEDKSKILCPLGLFLAGEELHAHHHADDTNPCFSRHWWEIDLGWIYCRVLLFIGLMKLTNYSK